MREMNLLVARGYSEIAIPMQSDDSHSRFTASAPFLKNVMAFSARAELPVDGRMTMGYFDPWVTPLITPVPPNEVAQYQCPMHDGIVSVTPGVCPLCGMSLMPILRTPRTALHAPEYDMTLETSLKNPLEGQPTTLTFTPLKNGSLFRDLMIVHTKILHLIIISSDFTFFDHVHPILQPNGSLTLTYTFPRTGTFLLYADITPTGERSQVFRLPVVVASPGDAPSLLMDAPDLTPSPAMAKALPEDPTMTAELFFQPRTPVAGIETHFLIRLTKDGRPVNDLEPYLAAMSHCVIISHDSQTFLHCHPEQLISPGQDSRAGPDVPFGTIFPKPGLYKLWAQFNRGGKIFAVDFTFDVKSPILPPNMIRFLLDD